MQEKVKPVFVIATANDISALPPEMLRKGRFDEIFFVDLPTKRERADIFSLHMKKKIKDAQVLGTLRITPEACAKLAEATEGFIGAEIEQVVVAALFEAFAESRALAWSDFGRAIKSTVPLSTTQAERIAEIRGWADRRAVRASEPDEPAAPQP
jgi:SpoVK/Ycf46/Vps4 family AAA+-type ATPase